MLLLNFKFFNNTYYKFFLNFFENNNFNIKKKNLFLKIYISNFFEFYYTYLLISFFNRKFDNEKDFEFKEDQTAYQDESKPLTKKKRGDKMYYLKKNKNILTISNKRQNFIFSFSTDFNNFLPISFLKNIFFFQLEDFVEFNFFINYFNIYFLSNILLLNNKLFFLQLSNAYHTSNIKK